MFHPLAIPDVTALNDGSPWLLVACMLMLAGIVVGLYTDRERGHPAPAIPAPVPPGEPPGILLEGISVVLPAHNEEDNIAEAIRQALTAAESVSRRQEVIVVDDGSRDSTAALALALRLRDARVRLVRHEHNRGYGSAVRSGIRAAEMEWVVLTDADLQFDLGQLSDFVPHTLDSELVVGYRAARQDPFVRRLNARGWNALVRLLFRIPARDVDAAFKLIRRDVLDGVALHSTGATIDTELFAKARRRGARMIELPVVHRPRPSGDASGAHPLVIARAFRELFQLWRDMRVLTVQPLGMAPGAPQA
jgi:glycosyltransferase involved in cell wall biosynthesis